MGKSNLDVAYEIMLRSEGPKPFLDLWNEISTIQNYSEDESKKRIAKFYTNLFMDGRFVSLANNEWDLRDGYKYEDVRIDSKVISGDDEEEEEIISDDDEENENSSDDNEEFSYDEEDK